eukprot:364700-Chlamydomonas_euryale.AAC.13
MHLADIATVIGRPPLALVEASPLRAQFFRRCGRRSRGWASFGWEWEGQEGRREALLAERRGGEQSVGTVVDRVGKGQQLGALVHVHAPWIRWTCSQSTHPHTHPHKHPHKHPHLAFPDALNFKPLATNFQLLQRTPLSRPRHNSTALPGYLLL